MSLHADFVSRLGDVSADLVQVRDDARALTAHAIELGWVEVDLQEMKVTATLPEGAFVGENAQWDNAKVGAAITAMLALDMSLTDEVRAALRAMSSRIPLQKRGAR